MKIMIRNGVKINGVDSSGKIYDAIISDKGNAMIFYSGEATWYLKAKDFELYYKKEVKGPSSLFAKEESPEYICIQDMLRRL